MNKKVVIIGAGPTGLFASSLLLNEGFSVNLYDQKKDSGRKLLLAGKSGLNITKNIPLDTFTTAYGPKEKLIEPCLRLFSPEDLRLWLKNLGIETFEGSTGGIFPVSITAKKLLDTWMDSLYSNKNFSFNTEHRLTKIDKENLYFETPQKLLKIKAPLLVMGMGGASYPSTGSDGKWNNILKKIGIEIEPFKPMNCGFEYSWSSHFKEYTNYLALKNIELTHKDISIRGEVMITSYGVEGGPFYRLSREIRNTIEDKQKATIHLDLTPDLSREEIFIRLNKKRGKNSLSNHLRKQLNITPLKISLLRELIEKNIFDDYSLLSQALKKVPLVLERTRPLEEAISSSGGVSFNELDEHFMLTKHPGWFTAGEMVDWDAPTGGYLLQACFSTAFTVVEGIKNL